MPSSVDAANPTVVMPYSLASSFQRSRSWAVDENLYRGGETQRQTLVATSRKTWVIAKPLTPAQLDVFRTFYESQNGGLQEFWFYDPWETSPKLSAAGYDMTGSLSTGRYVVRFEGAWQETLQFGRHQGNITLVEVS